MVPVAEGGQIEIAAEDERQLVLAWPLLRLPAPHRMATPRDRATTLLES